jgi:predicted AAA+ superfamily ATPase
MDTLRRAYQRLINETETMWFRYLYDSIRWSNRLIGIMGARGTGKTTLLLQHIKQTFPQRDKALYVSLDNIWFSKNTLSELAEQFYDYGGTHLFIDEVHRYKDWSIEIKNIYDSFPHLHIVFTGSSLLEVYRSQADLSRRAVCYNLYGLSFREYLQFENKLDIAAITLEDIITNHQNIAAAICSKTKILPEFRNYLSYGYYPFYREGIEDFPYRLQNVVNLILDNDLPAVENIEYVTIQKIKKLLLIVASLSPYSPNIKRLSEDIESNRNATLKYLIYLQKAALLRLLNPSQTSMSAMTKPEKVFLDNSNLLYTLTANANIGNVRETFFANQLSAKYEILAPEKGDFIVENKYIFEVGGKSKTYEQIRNIENSFIVADDLEIGYGNKIPLWMFGLLY